MFLKWARLIPLALCGWTICGCAAVVPPCADCMPPVVSGPVETVGRSATPQNIRPVSAQRQVISQQPRADQRLPPPPKEHDPNLSAESAEELSIDLPTALRLADA